MLKHLPKPHPPNLLLGRLACYKLKIIDPIDVRLAVDSRAHIMGEDHSFTRLESV